MARHLRAKYFKESLHKDSEPMSVLIPMPMKIPFTIKEIKSAWAVRKLKNNKIPGKVKISAELIKSAPDIAYEQIGTMYNNVAGMKLHTAH